MTFWLFEIKFNNSDVPVISSWRSGRSIYSRTKVASKPSRIIGITKATIDAYKENSEIYNGVKDYVQDRLTSTDESFASSVASAADTYGSKLAREAEVKESAANWNK